MTTITLKMTPAEASALSYLIAYAALKHTEGDGKLTEHEDSLVTKVAKLDPDSYTMWRDSVMRAAGGALA